ncbi:MAG: hypothetical protein LBK77_07865 [Spirochaetaceae bacterium]|jgi:hypothetical protein|nr:hypothetical protein [Spirochaetaceae bacterium]
MLCLLALCLSAAVSAQIFRGEGEVKNAAVSLSFHYIDYSSYRYLLYIDGVSVFLTEDHVSRLREILDKFEAWKTQAEAEQAALTKTIDMITTGEFHYNHTFFKEPLSFYFVFTGGPAAALGADPAAVYTLFVDTTLDRITPFRLSAETVRSFQDALTPEHLEEARDAYVRQKALEELFN